MSYSQGKIKNDIKKAATFNLKKLKKYQDIVLAQMNEEPLWNDVGKCKLNQDGLKKLQYMELIYQAARDIKEFDGSVNEWAIIIERK